MQVEAIIEAWDWASAGIGALSGGVLMWLVCSLLAERRDRRLQRQISELRRLSYHLRE